MTHRTGAIWTERLLLGLILISLGGTLNLLLAIHRQAPAQKEAPAESIVETHEHSPTPPQEPASLEIATVTETIEPQPAPPPADDPTKKAIASLAVAIEKETKAAEEADRRASSLEQGYRSAVAESDRWKRRDMLVRQQIAGITREAEKLEREADELDAERDVLERELDATKAALAKASARLRLRGITLQRAERHLAAANRDRMHRRWSEAPTKRTWLQSARALAKNPSPLERIRESNRPRAIPHSLGRHT